MKLTGDGRGRGRAAWAAPLVLATLVAILGVAKGCSREAGAGGSLGGARADPEPGDPAAFGQLTEFSLVNQDGKPVGLADLRGHVWALGTFFTACTGPCVELTKGMKQVQDQLGGTGVRLVSISVDPTRDSPQVMASYAKAYGADTSRWDFLSGDEGVIYNLIRTGFRLSAEGRQDGEAVAGLEPTHDTRLVAVDGLGVVRGYYDGRSEQGRQALVARLRALEQETH